MRLCRWKGSFNKKSDDEKKNQVPQPVNMDASPVVASLVSTDVLAILYTVNSSPHTLGETTISSYKGFSHITGHISQHN